MPYQAQAPRKSAHDSCSIQDLSNRTRKERALHTLADIMLDGL